MAIFTSSSANATGTVGRLKDKHCQAKLDLRVDQVPKGSHDVAIYLSTYTVVEFQLVHNDHESGSPIFGRSITSTSSKPPGRYH